MKFSAPVSPSDSQRLPAWFEERLVQPFSCPKGLESWPETDPECFKAAPWPGSSKDLAQRARAAMADWSCRWHLSKELVGHKDSVEHWLWC